MVGRHFQEFCYVNTHTRKTIQLSNLTIFHVKRLLIIFMCLYIQIPTTQYNLAVYIFTVMNIIVTIRNFVSTFDLIVCIDKK